jgi:hypothetical protein
MAGIYQRAAPAWRLRIESPSRLSLLFGRDLFGKTPLPTFPYDAPG